MATTPRPLIWQNYIPITDTSDETGTIEQYTNGNGKYFYLKDNKLQGRPLTITQGHWENVTIGSESQISDLDIKDYSHNQSNGKMAYGLAVKIEEIGEGDITNRLYLITEDFINNTRTEKQIHTKL